MKTKVHKFSFDTDRCTCGGVVVYFEDGDKDGLHGDGCEVADQVFDQEQAIVSFLEQQEDGEDYLIEINQGAAAWAVFEDWKAARPEKKVLSDGTEVTYCGPHRRWEWDCKECGAMGNTSRDLVCRDCGYARSDTIRARQAAELDSGTFWNRFEGE